MPYIFNGQPIDEAFVIEAAEVEGLSIEDYVNQKEGLELKEDPVDTDPFLKNVKKQMGPAEEAAPVGPVNQTQQNGESALEDSLLALVDNAIEKNKNKKLKPISLKEYQGVQMPKAQELDLDKFEDQFNNFKASINGVLKENGLYRLGVEGKTVEDLIGKGVFDNFKEKVISSYQLNFNNQALPPIGVEDMLEDALEKERLKELRFFNERKNQERKATGVENYQSTIDSEIENILSESTQNEKKFGEINQEINKLDRIITTSNDVEVIKNAENKKAELMPSYNALFEIMQTGITGPELKPGEQGYYRQQQQKKKAKYKYLFDPNTSEKIPAADAIYNPNTQDYTEEIQNLEQQYLNLDQELLDREFFNYALTAKRNREILNTGYNLKPTGQSSAEMATILQSKGYSLNDQGVFENVKLKDLRFMNPDFVQESFKAAQPKDKPYIIPDLPEEVEHAFAQKLQLNLQKEALKTTRILNIDPASMKQTGVDVAARFIETAAEASGLKGVLPTSVRKQLDETEKLFANAGIQLTEEQKKNFERSLGMKVVEGVGTFMPELAKFAIANKIAGAAGITRFIAQLAREGKKIEAGILTVALEEAKFEGVTLGEAPAGAGGGFALGGMAAAKFIPKFGKELARFNNIIEKTAGGAIGGVAGSNAAVLAEAMVSDLKGSESFKEYITDYYGSMDNALEEQVVSGIVFGILGASKIKSTDFKSVAARRKILDQLNADIVNGKFKGKELEKKQLLASDLERTMEQADRFFNKLNIAEQKANADKAYLVLKNEKSTKSEKRAAQKIVNNFEANKAAAIKSIKRQEARIKSSDAFKDFEGVEITEGQGDITKGNLAEYDPFSKKIKINLLEYTPGRFSQEVGHMFMDKAFSQNPQAAKMFQTKIKNTVETALKNKKFEVGDKTGLTFEEVINESYGEAKRPEEYVMNVVEFLSQPEYKDLLLEDGLLSGIKRSTINIGNRIGLDYTANKNFRTASELMEFLFSISKVAEGGSAKAIKNKFKQFEDLVIDGEKIKDISVEKAEPVKMGAKDLQLEKSNLVAERAEIIEAQKELAKTKGPKEKIDANVARIAEIKIELDKLDKNIKIAESNTKNTDIIKRELPLAEERAKANQDFRKDALGNILKDSKGEPILDVSKHKSALLQNAESNLLKDNQAIIQKEINRFDPKLGGDKTLFEGEILKNFSDLIKTYSAKKGEFGAYLRANLPKRTPTAFEVVGQRKAGREDLFEADVTEAKGVEAAEVDIEISSGKATDRQFETKTPFQGQQEGKGFILGKNTEIPKEIKDAIEAEILEGAKELDFENLNYGNIPNLAKKSIKKLFGTPKDRVQFLRNEAEGLYALLPEPAMKQAVTRTKSATGIAKTGLKVFYPETGLGRVTQEKERVSKTAGTAAGLIERTKLPFNKQLWLDTFGINKGQKQTRNQAESLQRTLEDAIGKAITNYTIRQIEGLAEKTKQRIADGKSEVMAAKPFRESKDFTKFILGLQQDAIEAKGNTTYQNKLQKAAEDLNLEYGIDVSNIIYTKNGKKTVNLEKLNTYNENSEKLSEYFPDWLGTTLFNGVTGHSYRNTGKYRKATDLYDSAGNSIKKVPMFFGTPTGAKAPKSWQSIDSKSKSAIYNAQKSFAQADKIISAARSANKNVNESIRKAEGIARKAASKLNPAEAKKFFDAIQESYEAFINEPKLTKEEKIQRVQHIAQVKKHSQNIIFGEKQFIPALAVEKTKGAAQKRKVEHVSPMSPLNGDIMEIFMNPAKNYKTDGKKLLDDSFVILGYKSTFDAVDAVGGTTNSNAWGRLSLAFDKLNDYQIIDSQTGKITKETLLDHMIKKFDLKNVPSINVLKRPWIKEAVMKHLGKDTPASKILLENAIKYETAYKKAWQENALMAKNSKVMAAKKIKAASNTELVNALAQKESKLLSVGPPDGLNKEFNQLILRPATGFKGSQKIGAKRAAIIGKGKGKWDIVIGPKSDDFVGLLYRTLGKGAQGEAQMEFYKKNLLDPYARGVDAVSRNRVKLLQSVKQLGKQLDVAPKKLKKAIPEAGGFTGNQVMQLYIWNKLKYDIPDLTKTELKNALDYIKTAPELQAFADQLIALTDGKYQKPGKNWEARNIVGDLIALNNEGVRSEYLKQFNENKDIIFSKENLNKLEATYGTSYREALENSLQRMVTGRNKSLTGNKTVDKFQEWINGAVGTTMFFNSRSAVLQTISTANYINWSDNNPLAAGKAFANIPQYTKDFKMIFNSDYLINRRGGLKINVEDAQIAELAQQGGVQGFFSKLLKKGFLPTQIADSFAISAGGATFYRNRVNTYLKQGMKLEAAELNAFRDFQKATEESQQSSDPSKISMEQASTLGRTILAYANTPSQYARLSKKAVLDLYNRRGSDKENLSKLAYYTFMQNLIFNTLQKGLFALAFDGDEYPDASIENKAYDVANSMSDSVLRGMGIPGAAVSTVKNIALRLQAEAKKDRPKYSEAAWNLLDLSPPIDSKVTRIRSGLRSYEFNEKKMKKMGPTLDNPFYMANAQIISGATNIPLDRLLLKYDNVSSAMEQDREFWQRTALLMGWPEWQLEPPKPKKPKAPTKQQKRKRQEEERKKNLLKRFE